MPLFNDLKKIFFGAKSVAKHQAGKAGDAARDAAEDLRDLTTEAAREFMDKAPGYVDQGKDALSGLGDKIWTEAEGLADKGRELKDQASDAVNSKLEELRPKEEAEAEEELDLDFGKLDLTPRKDAPKSGSIDYESDLVEGNPVRPEPSALRENLDTGLDAAARAGAGLAGKIGGISEVVGEKVLEKGGELLDRAAEAGSKLKDRADDFVDHASRQAEKMKMEQVIEDAKIAAAQAEARARAFDGKETARDASESTLDGTDSFFDRADRFAKGDYTNEGGKKMVIQDNPDHQPKPKGGIISGFEDADGDGDSLIDDAIIEEE